MDWWRSLEGLLGCLAHLFACIFFGVGITEHFALPSPVLFCNRSKYGSALAFGCLAFGREGSPFDCASLYNVFVFSATLGDRHRHYVVVF